MGREIVAILVKSKTYEGAKNRFSTRWECFFDAAHLFLRDTGQTFQIDVAAEAETAKVNRYYASPTYIESLVSGYDGLKPQHPAARLLNPVCVGFDALQGEWEDGWWCNPPFDLKFQFIEKAVEQARKGRNGMMLLPYEPLTGWWIDLVEGYSTMIYEPDGRYSFYEHDGCTKKHGVNFGSVLVLFTQRGLQTPRQRFYRKSGLQFLTSEVHQKISNELSLIK